MDVQNRLKEAFAASPGGTPQERNPMNPILLLVTYHAHPGKGAAFLRAVNDMGILQKIRSEEGLIAYDYFYSANDPDTVLLVEEWASDAHQARHLATPHMAELARIKAEYISDTTVRKIPLA